MQGKAKQKQKKQDANAKGSAKGRNKDKCARYFSEGRRALNKLKRILKSNGPGAARKWANANGALAILSRIANKKKIGSDDPSKIALVAKLAMKGV